LSDFFIFGLINIPFYAKMFVLIIKVRMFMDIKCKNCGQMIDEKDKYCKYCGYLIPQKENKVQETKATVYEQDIVDSKNYPFENLAVIRQGDKNSLYTKSVMLTILSFCLGLVFLVIAVVSKFLIPKPMVAFICLFIFMLAMICAFGFTLERYYNSKGIKNIKDNEITIRKYGFKKPAEVLIDGHIFEIVTDNPCPVCEGDIIGDLHIEKIENKIVVVCNINRKHIFRIDETEFVTALRNGEINTYDKGKNKAKKQNNAWKSVLKVNLLKLKLTMKVR